MSKRTNLEGKSEEYKKGYHCGAKMIGGEKLEFFDRRLNVLEDMEAHNND